MNLRPPKPVSHWYELDLLLPYRDLILVLGFFCVVYGVRCWSGPGAWIVGGAGLIAASWRMA